MITELIVAWTIVGWTLNIINCVVALITYSIMCSDIKPIEYTFIFICYCLLYINTSAFLAERGHYNIISLQFYQWFLFLYLFLFYALHIIFVDDGVTAHAFRPENEAGIDASAQGFFLCNTNSLSFGRVNQCYLFTTGSQNLSANRLNCCGLVMLLRVSLDCRTTFPKCSFLKSI